MQPVIVQGDKTSHGGTVLQGSPFSDTHGKPIARLGDMVSCPLCKGVFPIAEGDSSNIIDGAPVAFHGCKVACGATLIAGQMFTQTNPSAGAAPGAGGSDDSSQVLEGYGPVGAGMAAAYESEPTDNEKFRGRFQLIDMATGQPIAGRTVRVSAPGAAAVIGLTDDEGYTTWTEQDNIESITFDIVQGDKS